MSSRIFGESWENATTAAGMQGLLVHDLRRSGTRKMRRAGVDRDVIIVAIRSDRVGGLVILR